MQPLDDKLRVNLSITLSSEALAAARERGESTHGVVAFAFDDGDIQCDGEISLRFRIKD